MSVEVEFAAPPSVVHAYLADPANRPAWQSSLKRVDDVVERGGRPGGLGSTWTDVTKPGVKPRMEVTVDEPPARWAERGTWGPISATLRLDLEAHGAGTRVRVAVDMDVPVWMLPLRLTLPRLAPYAVRADLRNASKILGAGR